MHRHVAGLIALAFLTAAGCGGSSSSPGGTPRVETPTPAGQSPSLPSATPTVGLTPSPTATTTSSDGRLEVAATVQLVEAESGAVKVLVQERTRAVFARIVGREVLATVDAGQRHFDLDGKELPAPAPPAAACQGEGESARVAGQPAPNAFCPASTVSPDGRWLLYPVVAGEKEVANGFRVPVWDQWLVELPSGAPKLVQPGLVHCGGCDARYGPRWSASGGYVVYAELGGEGRRFLTDVVRGATRQIGTGNEVSFAPAWHPLVDYVVFASPGDAMATVADAATSAMARLSLPWPVAWDPSGRLLYSPAWGEGPKQVGATTTVIDFKTTRILASVPGAPHRLRVWSPASPVVWTEDGVISALQYAEGCAGTAIYRDSTRIACIEGGDDATISREGVVAVAKRVGETGPVQGPTFESVSAGRYEIVLVDGESTRTVISGAISGEAPFMQWDSSGDHLLVQWPYSPGL